MNEQIKFENRVLELLNAETSVQRFLARAVLLIEEACDHLISKIFRKDDYAVKFAVDALLASNGPLAELSVKLKLLYAIGIIAKEEYNDSEYLLSLYEELSDENTHLANEGSPKIVTADRYQFSDEEVMAICHQLHCVEVKPLSMSSSVQPEMEFEDPSLVKLQQKRHRQMIKSTLVLSLTQLINQLYQKPAEKISPLA